MSEYLVIVIFGHSQKKTALERPRVMAGKKTLGHWL